MKPPVRNRALFTAILVVAVSATFVMLKWSNKTEYSNCVAVSVESDFVGQWLKHRGERMSKIRLTAECEEMDVAQDGGNGPKAGRIRWAECLAGPDCDEAGMY